MINKIYPTDNFLKMTVEQYMATIIASESAKDIVDERHAEIVASNSVLIARKLINELNK